MASASNTPKSISNTNHPQVLYWFLSRDHLDLDKTRCDVEYIAQNLPFDLVFLTAQGKPHVDFHDVKTMRPVFQTLVGRAHELGIKVGLQLFPASQNARNQGNVPCDEAQALACEHELALDSAGRCEAVLIGGGALNRQPFASELLRVYAFRAEGPGFYDLSTLRDITAHARVISSADDRVSVVIDAPACAGLRAYALTTHYYRYGDLYSGYHARRFAELLDAYGDIPFDGAALDEFGYFYLPAPWDRKPGDPPVRQRFAGRHYARAFEQQTGLDFARTLFDMRLAPAGKPEVRIRATNLYFDFHRAGPLRTENAFAAKAREVFGPDVFLGVHNTAHNSLVNDEIWKTGCNWWSLPRRYGQTDEDISWPVRMGVACSCEGNVTYDMYYRHNDSYLAKAVRDARYGGRLHYLGLDATQYAMDFRDPAFVRPLNAVERKIRLLNWFNAPLPAAELLIVFGMPALANWYPDETSRNEYDINGALDIEGKAQAVWDAGYLCALAPSDAVDDGRIRVSGNALEFGGRRFKGLLYLYPQYAKHASLEFLERAGRAGVPLMIEGVATHDFSAHDIAERFRGIAARATVLGFDVAKLPQMGIATNPYHNGCSMADGSVVWTDLASILGGPTATFDATLHGHRFSGTFVGVCAIDVDETGQVRRFACSGFRSLQRDGVAVLTVDTPTDIRACRDENGQLRVLAPTA